MAAGSSLSDFLLSLPNLKGLSPRSLILLGAYHLLQVGKTNFTANELSTALAAAAVPRQARLRDQLVHLSRGRKAPIFRLAGSRFALSLFGQNEVQDYLGITARPTARPSSLAALVGRISGEAEKQFLAEAIACLEVEARRAVVVMIWLMTVDHMQRYVLTHKLVDFNTAWARRPDNRGRAIAVQDHFLEIRDESTFIEILRSAAIITNDVRKILDEKLGFRNTCAHPNDIVIPESKVLAAIEDLVYNVLLKYPI